LLLYLFVCVCFFFSTRARIVISLQVVMFSRKYIELN
jgi:hypothetical protein